MPDEDEPSLLETVARAIARRAFGGLSRYAEQILKRILRLAGLYVAGLVLALIGVGFLATGVVKWLAMMLPSWLAWLIVGVIMLLLGMVLTLATLVASRG